MAADIIIASDNSTNTSLYVYDTTDYIANSALISDITAVRFLFATYNSLQGQVSTKTLVENYEYQVISGSITINGVTYVVGDKFVPQQAITADDSVIIYPTGYFTQYNDLTPSQVDYFEFYPSNLGENDSTFIDADRFVRYETYRQNILAGSVSAGTYIVKGAQNDFILIGSEKYYVGEVFTKSTAFTFSGTPTLAKQFLTGTFEFWTNASASIVYQDYVNALSNRALYQSEDFKDNFIATNTNYTLPYFQADLNLGSNSQAIQASLDVINNFLSTQNKDIK